MKQEGFLMIIKKYVNEKVVSDVTGWSLQTLRNHRHLNKAIPYIKCGRSVRYDLDDVHGYMQSKKIRTES